MKHSIQLSINDVYKIAEAVNMKKLEFLINSNSRSAFYSAKSRKQQFLSTEVSEKILNYARSIGYEQ